LITYYNDRKKKQKQRTYEFNNGSCNSIDADDIVSVGVLNSSSILLPMANAQKPQHAEFGTIASIQNGKDGKPAWVTSGVWDFNNINSNSPRFNATFQMFMLNGSAAHKHTITDMRSL
jgi:hypothetical protein